MRHSLLSGSRLRWLCLAEVALAFGIGCSSVPLRLPEQVRALPDPTETRTAILIGMQQRKWNVMDERPQAILAGIDVRSHVAKMWVEYDAEFVRFRYGGSTGLDCRPEGDGCSSIHKKYLQWTRNLAKAISEEIAARRTPSSSATGGKSPSGR